MQPSGLQVAASVTFYDRTTRDEGAAAYAMWGRAKCLDALGRLQQTKQAVDGVVNKRVVYTYRDDGSVQTVTRYADDSTPTPVAQSVYTYDGMGRLASLTHTPAIAYTWTYDAASRIIGMTSPDGVADDFSYDATDQLTGVDYDYQADESYAYDANGNRQSANGSDYTIDDNNQLTSDGQFTYAYDREGHRTARFVDNDADGLLSSGDSQVTQCAWDHRDRLSGVTQYATQGDAATSSVHYVYDSQGRRTETLVDSDGDGSADEHRYTVFQGDHPCLEVTDADGLGAGQDTQLAHRYLYGQALDEILAVEDGSGMVRWGLADHEGTIRDVLDASGLLVDHRCYDSFGRSMGQTDTAVDFLFGYAGRPWDAQTGLYDNRARWYDPAVGRFLSEDPSGFADGQDLNLYRYVGNNPINCTDPSGMCAQSLWNGFSSAASSVSSAVSNTWSSIRPTFAQAAVDAYEWGLGASNYIASMNAAPLQTTLSEAPLWTPPVQYTGPSISAAPPRSFLQRVGDWFSDVWNNDFIDEYGGGARPNDDMFTGIVRQTVHQNVKPIGGGAWNATVGTAVSVGSFAYDNSIGIPIHGAGPNDGGQSAAFGDPASHGRIADQLGSGAGLSSWAHRAECGSRRRDLLRHRCRRR